MTMLPYREGEQFSLRFEAWPWDGQHPRDLTAGADFLRFATRGAPAEPGNQHVDAFQLEMFPEGTP